MKLVKRIILTMLAVCFGFYAFACNSKLTFEDYSYSDDWSDADWQIEAVRPYLDADTQIDGVFDESLYSGKTPFVYSAENGKYNVELTVAFGKNGLYFKTIIQDPNLYYNLEQTVYDNTSLILYISPYGALDKNTIQARTGVNGYQEQWYGSASSDGYKYTRAYVKMASATNHIKTDGSSVEVLKKTAVNLDTNMRGWDCESFVPYSEIGLKAKPESVVVGPEINTKLSFSGDRTLYSPAGMDYANPMSWFVFDQTGYKANAPKPTKPIQGSEKLSGSEGWDGSQYDINGTIRQSGTKDQRLYFKDINSDKYFIEADITANSVLGGDNYPKYGLLTAESNGNTFCYFVDPLPTFTQKTLLTVDRTEAGDNWTWSADKSFLNTESINPKSVRLGVARDGADFYFYVNGYYNNKQSNIRTLSAGVKSMAGFMTMNMDATYSNIIIETDSEKVDEIIFGRQYRFTPPAIRTYELGSSEWDLTDAKLVTLAPDMTEGTENLLDDAEISVLSELTLERGLKTATVRYGGGEWTFTINVIASVNSLSVVDDGEYVIDGNITTRIGEGVNADIAKVNVDYAYIDDETLTFNEAGVELIGFDKWQTGVQNVSVRILDKTAQISITVIGAIGDSQMPLNVMGNYDISEDEGASPIAKAVGTGDNYAYLAGLNASSYVFETKIKITDVLQNDSYPKVGVIASAREDGKRLLFFADPRPDKSLKEFLFVHNLSGAWNWPGQVVNIPSVNYSNAITFKIVKQGANFYAFINGEFVSHTTVQGFEGNTVAGFATMNHRAEYTEYSFSTTQDDIDLALEGATLPENITIDGDISDWHEYSTVFENSVIVENDDTISPENAGKNVSFYAFIGEDGLYLATVAEHEFFHNGNPTWHQNTNFEIYLNGASGSNQRFVTADFNSLNMIAYMKTVDSGVQGATRYTTTVEVFIAFKDIPNYVSGNEFIRVGFAWKTSGEFFNGEHDNMVALGKDSLDNWWYASNHAPNNAGAQYYVYSDGIFSDAKN